MFARAWTAVVSWALSVQGQGPAGQGFGYGHPGNPPVVEQRDFVFPAGTGPYQLVIRNPDFVNVPLAAHAMQRFLQQQTNREHRDAHGHPHLSVHHQREQQAITNLLRAFFHDVGRRHMSFPRPDREGQIVIGLLPPGELPVFTPEQIPVEIDFTPVVQNTGATSSGNAANTTVNPLEQVVRDVLNDVIREADNSPVVTGETPGYYVMRPTSDEAEETLTTPAANSTATSSDDEVNVVIESETNLVYLPEENRVVRRQDLIDANVICTQPDIDDERRFL